MDPSTVEFNTIAILFNTIVILVAITTMFLTIVRQLSRHGDKLASLDTKVGTLDTKVDALDTKVDALDSRVGALDSKVGALDVEVRANSRRLDELSAESRERGRVLGEVGERLARVEGYLMPSGGFTVHRRSPAAVEPSPEAPGTVGDQRDAG